MNVMHVEPPRLGRDPLKNAGEQTLEHRVYGSFQEISHLKNQWNDLALRTGDILCTYDWCEVWWQHFGPGRRLEIHTLHSGPQLVAVLPLFRETVRPGGVWLRTVRVVGCDYTINTVGLAVEPTHAETFIQIVVDTLSRTQAWDILQIAALRSYNVVTEPMAAACSRHPDIQATIIGRQDNWCTLFHLPRTYDEFLGSLPSKTRSEIQRRERQLGDKHTVEIEAVSDPQRVMPVMDLLVKMHQQRWTGRGQPGQFGGAGDVEQFHRDMAQRLQPTGQLLLLVLKADGHVLSVTYGYRFGQRLHALFGSHCYDEQWQRFGLGRIMYCHLIRYAIDQGVSVLEDGRGVFEHKLSLGGRLHGERSLTLVHRGWSTRLRFWAALHTAYIIHVLYSRVWVDMIAPRLRVRPNGRHFHVRYGALAQLHRRVRFRLIGGPAVLETRCPKALPTPYQNAAHTTLSPDV